MSVDSRDSRSRVAGILGAAFRWLLILIFGLSLVAVARAGGERQTILVFGDSLSTAYGFDISRSWVSLLESRLRDHNPPYRVVNVSISGETTGGGAARIQSAIAEHAPEIVLVELGGNDGLRGIGLETTERNLEAIVDAGLSAGARVLLLAMELPPNYGRSYIEGFRQIYQRLGQREGVTLVPFFLDGVARDPSLMQPDGIHPRAEAQPKLLQNIWPYLGPVLTE